MCYCNVTVVVFTTYWKFQCCCIHCLFGVNECQWLVYTHTFPFIPTWYYLMIPNTCITFPLTHCIIFEYKNGNDVSEFMHPNWITLSYYLSAKHRVWSLNIQYTSLTSVHSNLEHMLAMLQRALVHSNLNYTTSLVKVQIRSPLQ